MDSASISSSLEVIAGGVVVVPVAIVVVVGTVVVSVVIVTKRVRGFATLFNDGKVESDNDADSSNSNTNGDRTNDDLTFRFIWRRIGVTFLLKVFVAGA